MRALRNVMLGAALLALPALAAAQDRDDRNHDRDHRAQNGGSYRSGNQGKWRDRDGDRDRDDRDRRNRNYRNNGAYQNNNGAYRNNNGYYGNSGSYGNGSYGNGNYGNSSYGRYGNSGNPAAQMGFQDGLVDGQSARAQGRGMTYGPGYNHPDRGYINSYGDKNLYKQQYRQAYQQGFQQGYNGGAGGRGLGWLR